MVEGGGWGKRGHLWFSITEEVEEGRGNLLVIDARLKSLSPPIHEF